MCEGCLAHQEANSVAFNQALASGSLRTLDYEIRRLEMSSAQVPKQANQEPSIGDAIVNVQNQIDNVFGALEDLEKKLDPILTPVGPQTATDAAVDGSVKFITDIEYANQRLRGVRERVQDLTARSKI